MTEQEICESYRKAEHKAKQISVISQLSLRPISEVKEILIKNGYLIPEVKHRKPKSAAVEEPKSLPTAVLVTLTDKIDSLDKEITELEKRRGELLEQLTDLTAFLEEYMV